MKKVFFLFITTTCFLQIKGLAQKSQVGLTGGASFSNVYGDIGGLDNRGKPRIGFTGGLVVETPIGKSNFSFQPGILYTQKGKYTVKTDAVKEADALRYADLVLNFIHYSKGKGKMRLFFGLGPQVGFNLPSKKIKVEDDKRTEVRTIAFGEDAPSDYRGLDWGINGLLGFRCKNGIFFSANYTFGLRNLVPDPAGDNHLRNGAVGVRLGYFFSNTPREKKPREKKK